MRIRFVPNQDRGPAIGSSCLGGLLATGIALTIAWLDARMVAAVWNRCDVGIGSSANGFVLMVTLAPVTMGYLVLIVLGDDLVVRVVRRGADLWVTRLVLLGAAVVAGSFAVFLLHGLPITNDFCVAEPRWLPF